MQIRFGCCAAYIAFSSENGFQKVNLLENESQRRNPAYQEIRPSL